jgi:hypothetical protein
VKPRRKKIWPSSLCSILLPVLVLLASVPSCIQKFDYTPQYSGDRLLVVDGGITTQPEKQFLRLSRTAPYGSGEHYPESGASFKIIENGKVVDNCYEISEGTYQINGDFINPQPGNVYAIEIITRDGKIYQSDPEVMPEPIKPDSSYFKIQMEKIPSESGTYVNQPSVNIYVDTPVRANGSPAYLRWRVTQDYSFTEIKVSPLVFPRTCYMAINTTSQDIYLYDGSDVSGGILKEQLVFTRYARPDYEFYFVHYFRISQYSLTKNAFDYWNKLKQIANPSGSFLDPPPAAVIGNVHNVDDPQETVLGYFEVAAQEYTSTFTNSSKLLPFFIKYPCTDDVPDYCYNCLVLPNSTLDRPAYWHH